MDKPITLCDRCDIVMSCLLDYDGIPCRRNRTVEPTNADRIRAMTDEELAVFLHSVIHDWMQGDAEVTLDGKKYVIEDWLDWLKQEVQE